MKQVDEKLKQFMLDNFDFDGLKEAGFYPKGTRRTDYQAQAERVCRFFGFETVYEYVSPEVEQVGENTYVTTSPTGVTGQGVTVATGLFHVMPDSFDCPICTAPQTVNPAKTNGTPHRCSGCKRKLHVILPLFDSTGKIEVTEW